MRYLKYPMLVLILAVSTSLGAGAIHKWVDDKGNVHYGDVPPVKTISKNVRVQSAPSNPGKALPRLSSPEDSDQAAGAEQKVSEEDASQICATAKADLEIISTSQRVQLQMADGNIRDLTEAEIAERRASSQVDIDRYCN